MSTLPFFGACWSLVLFIPANKGFFVLRLLLSLRGYRETVLIWNAAQLVHTGSLNKGYTWQIVYDTR